MLKIIIITILASLSIFMFVACSEVDSGIKDTTKDTTNLNPEINLVKPDDRPNLSEFEEVSKFACTDLIQNDSCILSSPQGEIEGICDFEGADLVCIPIDSLNREKRSARQ